MKDNKEVRFVDTTLRDGNQSLWALTMSTSMILPIARRMNDAGFSTVEVVAPGHFKAIVREAKEDPWERIRLVCEAIPDVPVAVMQQCSITGMGIVPKVLAELWFKSLSANGVRRVFLMEASNDFSLRVPDYVRYAKQAGIEATLALTYSISPKHTDEHFAQKARDAIALNPAAIYLKDPGGLLTPERIRTIVPAILNSAGSTPVELHSHCTTGLAPLCYLEAVKLGIRTLHTAIPPLANGSGQPSLFNIAENLRHLGYAPHVNEDIIRPVSEHLKYVAKREGRVMGAPVEYEEYQYIHQIPGGVISNLKRQLAQLKLLDRMPQVIEETIRVRQDFGYPIMVTPFSQYMATQAAINVVLGERYKQVADDVIYYAMGFWGKEAAEAIDPEVRDKVLGSPRAKELKNWQPPEPTLAEVRRQYGEELSDDELLLRYMIGNDDDIKAMRAAGPLDKEKYVGAATPVRTLIEELLKRRDLSYVSVRGAGLDIAMER